MASVESVINWFRAREGRVTYSMSNRLGPTSYDCSSAVYFALIEAGFLPKGTGIGNTESLYRLEGSLMQPIARTEARRGDIFVSGNKGGSGGANGHTGIFVTNSRIIHCNYGSNGISETSTEGGWLGGPPTYCYRLKGATNENQKPKMKGEKTMMCIYERPINGQGKPDNNSNTWGVYFCNGVNTRYVNHPDVVHIIKEVYQKNNGQAIPEYNRKQWPKNAPWYARLESAFPTV